MQIVPALKLEKLALWGHKVPLAWQTAGAEPGSEELLWAEGKPHGQGKAAGRQCRRRGHVPGVGQGTLLKNEK